MSEQNKFKEALILLRTAETMLAESKNFEVWNGNLQSAISELEQIPLDDAYWEDFE